MKAAAKGLYLRKVSQRYERNDDAVLDRSGMGTMSKHFVTIFACALVAIGILPAQAHHAVVGEYGNVAEPPTNTLVGEVTDIRWASPHIRIRIMVLEGDHAGETWDITGHEPALMARTYGFLPGGVKVGDTITALGWVNNFNAPRMVPRALSINGGPMHSVLQIADRRDLRDGTLGDIIAAPSVVIEKAE